MSNVEATRRHTNRHIYLQISRLTQAALEPIFANPRCPLPSCSVCPSFSPLASNHHPIHVYSPIHSCWGPDKETVPHHLPSPKRYNVHILCTPIGVDTSVSSRRSKPPIPAVIPSSTHTHSSSHFYLPRHSHTPLLSKTRGSLYRRSITLVSYIPHEKPGFRIHVGAISEQQLHRLFR